MEKKLYIILELFVGNLISCIGIEPIDKVDYIGNFQEHNYVFFESFQHTIDKVLPIWAWGNPNYTFTTSKAIQKVEIDPSLLMADVDRSNNIYEVK